MKLFFMIFAVMTQVLGIANAGMIFTIQPAAGFETITLGGTGQFKLYIRSNVAGGEQIDSIDVNVKAGAGNGTAGVFSSGTTTLLGNVPFDVSSTPGQAFSTNFLSGGTLIPFASGVGSDLGVQYGALQLSTLGIGPGTYPITLDQLNANPFYSGIGAPPAAVPTFAVNSSFTITSVPEPSSLWLMGLCVISLVTFQQVNRKFEIFKVRCRKLHSLNVFRTRARSKLKFGCTTRIRM